MINPQTGCRHEDGRVSTALNGVVLEAAPGAGMKIRVYRLFGASSGVEVGLRWGAANIVWQAILTSYRPWFDADPLGIFELPENEALVLHNPGLGQVYCNYSFEIQPVDM